jgi:hypothetical protein
VYAISPLVFVAGGAWATVEGIATADQAGTLMDRGVQTRATVTAQETTCASINSKCTVDLNYTFTTPDGLRHAGTGNNADAVGPEINIWYDPQHPDELSTMHPPDGKGVWFIVLGAVFALAGLALTTWLVIDALR